MKEINEDIKEYAKKHNLKIKCFINSIYVQSLFDEWIIKNNRNNKYIIQHCNKPNKRNKKPTGKFHKQRSKIFFSQFCALRYIFEHDKYKMGCNRNNVIKM